MYTLTPTTPEPVRETLWDVAQEAASFALTLVTLAIALSPAIVWGWRKWKRYRIAEVERRNAERRAEIEAVVEPMRERLDQIHHTTHTNGGRSNPPTLKDDICLLRGDIRGLISAVAMNTARQVAAEERGRETYEAARAALRKQGIELPEYDE